MAKKIILDEQTKKFYEEKAASLLKSYLLTGNEEFRREHTIIIKYLKEAKVVNGKHPYMVYVGSKVKVLFDGDEDVEEFNVVMGSANAALSEVSIDSPVGEAILGGLAGEVMTCPVRGKDIKLRIVSCDNGQQKNDTDERQ